MKIFIIDPSGKLDGRYTGFLCNALQKQGVEVVFAQPKMKFLSKSFRFLPLLKIKSSKEQSVFKRGIVAIQTFINYCYLILHFVRKKYDVVHFQWLPFLEISTIERYFLCLYKKLQPKAKFVFTVHNVYPHDCSSKLAYKQRFESVQKYFDKFIVHAESSKGELQKEFSINANRINVVFHGLFEPDMRDVFDLPTTDKFRILMFGVQSYYKGTDLLIDALQQLPEEAKNKIEVNILGQINNEFYQLLSKKTAGRINVIWHPNKVSDVFLNSYLNAADLIVLPYRAISASGVLALSLCFEKCILTSNLPTFKEYLSSFEESCFFETENAASFSSLIAKHISGEINQLQMKEKIVELKKKYSWEQVGLNTIEIYKSNK